MMKEKSPAVYTMSIGRWREANAVVEDRGRAEVEIVVFDDCVLLQVPADGYVTHLVRADRKG